MIRFKVTLYTVIIAKPKKKFYFLLVFFFKEKEESCRARLIVDIMFVFCFLALSWLILIDWQALIRSVLPLPSREFPVTGDFHLDGGHNWSWHVVGGKRPRRSTNFFFPAKLQVWDANSREAFRRWSRLASVPSGQPEIHAASVTEGNSKFYSSSWFKMK